jgi:sugar/nucleoside kinase (ribokinase family)
MTGRPDYLLIGHATADLTPEGRTLGGTVSFGARVTHAFGLKTSILTSAAANEPLLDGLAPYADVVSLPADATSTFENIYTPDGRIQYVRGVARNLTAANIPDEWRPARLVHLAPLTDEVDPQIAHEFPDSLVLLTLQGWLRRWDADGRVRFKPWFDADVLRDIDILVYSEEDIVQAPQLEQQFIDNVDHVIITRAERGGTYFYKGQRAEYDTPQVQVVNPTGAGDIFAAAVLAGQHVLGDMMQAIRVAARLGATSVTRVGLDSAPTSAEVEQAIAVVRSQINA